MFTDISNRFVVVKGERRRSGKDWEFGVNRCKLLHLKWISNEVLLYITGNYVQTPGIDHDEKKKYIYICIYMTESLFCTTEIGKTL